MVEVSKADLIARLRYRYEPSNPLANADVAEVMLAAADALESSEREIQLAEDQANNLAGDLAQAELKIAALESVTAPTEPDREVLIQSLKVAMLGTTDGGFIDMESDIPAGEMFRLAAEWVAANNNPQPVQVEVTDDMVKRADAAYWKSVDDCDEHADPMRAALEAALGGGE